MHIVKQKHRGSKGPDGSNDTAADRKDGDRREARAPGERLKALIAKKMAGSALAGTPKRCPRCKSLSFYCKGHDACGLQRWKCRSCGRTFSARTRSVLAMLKLTAATWAAYAKGTLAGMSLKGACEELPCEP
ncbi:MAG: IS1 family transposase [Coriobacteriaceae bacterium]|nr:MAG: IS1 family transposase [Coriobacteriaceae bacterium]